MADRPDRPETLSALFERHRGRLVRYARRWLVRSGDPDAAEECVQAGSAQFLEQRRDFRTESHFVRLWRRFAQRASQHERRRARAHKRGGGERAAPLPTDLGAGPSLAATGPQTAAARNDEHAALLAELDQLKPDYQQLVQLRLGEDLEWGEIARSMQLPSPDAARKKFGYAMAQLRERLRDREAE
ncbi:MAG: sigma-70 family RNA polymerase sigma factor [Planctomycetota bacterium]